MIAKIKNYFSDVSKEMRKVSWPTRQQLRESTVVVTVTCLIITAFVWIVDVAMSFIMQQLY
ncbi:MAG: preprotein translocase subunit SecE [Bacteroidota bacterium]|nr:preprotein translocase subunit SecE [Candidatus Kapabacteria bacterium]MCS7301818.1 preprotein translocase subunit SecE [Candidatus Kapabacteria bacterium]MDW8075035.1 preprotein translocase subunit SecE [Bacteroidota bacterium]MDW8271674.1 preprotein translocase subunit SecE [Bacteroidota bacterium]